jgi:hypothetical protein
MRSIKAALFPSRRYPVDSSIYFRGFQMCDKKITTIQGLITYVKNNSSWSAATICNVITTLGYNPNGNRESLVELSGNLADCAKHGADGGFPGFTCYSDTLSFFRRNRQDIVKNLELLAKELGEDIISMVQHFGVFRYGTPPTSASIGQALWGRSINQPLQCVCVVLFGRSLPYLVQVFGRQPPLLCGIVRIAHYAPACAGVSQCKEYHMGLATVFRVFKNSSLVTPQEEFKISRVFPDRKSAKKAQYRFFTVDNGAIIYRRPPEQDG